MESYEIISKGLVADAASPMTGIRKLYDLHTYKTMPGKDGKPVEVLVNVQTVRLEDLETQLAQTKLACDKIQAQVDAIKAADVKAVNLEGKG